MIAAEEFLEDYQQEYFQGEVFGEFAYKQDEVVKAMIEFAKMHVKEALMKISNSDISDLTEWSGNPFTGEGSDYVSIKKVLNIYPLDNIK